MCDCEDRPCCGCDLENRDERDGTLDAERYFERDDDDAFVPDDDDEPFDGFRSDAEADGNALESVYGRDDDGSFYDDYDGCPGADQYDA